MGMDISGVISTTYDPTMIRDYLEKAIAVELTDTLLGRNLCFKVFRFPNNAWSYTWMKRGYTRATVLNEFGAPPMVFPKVNKFGMEYQEIGTAVGISDRMIKFGDVPAMEMAIDASTRAMRLKQDRDVINTIMASVPYYHDGSTPLYLRLQNADLKEEWKTFTLVDHENNRCSKNRSHVIVGDAPNNDYPTPPDDGAGDLNRSFLLDTLNNVLDRIEEHLEGKVDVCLMNPRQKMDFRNFVDFSGTNKPSIAPPQFNAIMTKGWVGEWMGVNFIATHAVTPGVQLYLDSTKVCLLGEYSAPFIEGGIRDQWRTWQGQTWRQYYNPACPETDYIAIVINLNGDTKADNTTPLDHTVVADVDAQYTKVPSGGQERAGLPG